MSGRLLLDNSAWVRIFDPAIPDDRADEIADEIGEGELLTCLPFLLEAGYSARSGKDHQEIAEDLGALDTLAIGAEVERRALEAQAQLARIGHHRLPPVDLIVAALADHHGVGVLHYDGDYDVLAEKTDLDFESRWLMPRGSLS